MSALTARIASSAKHYASPHPTTYAALISLGYMIVRCAPDEPYAFTAHPNDHTVTLGTSRWIGVPNMANLSAEDLGDLRAVTHDRGGRLLWGDETVAVLELKR